LCPSKYFDEIFAEITLSYNDNKSKRGFCTDQNNIQYFSSNSVSSPNIDDERGRNV
jgi:hypothetical protein